jgi:hypothetical protein
MPYNLTPNPFFRARAGKGDRKEKIPFPRWEGEPEGIARKIGASPPARAPRIVAIGVVAIYRAAVSPVIQAMNGPACRFEPSCSAYARDAIAEYGIVRGGAMAIWRVARCNPLGGHGFDPVRGRGATAGLQAQNLESRAQGTRWTRTLTFILSLAGRGDRRGRQSA